MQPGTDHLGERQSLAPNHAVNLNPIEIPADRLLCCTISLLDLQPIFEDGPSQAQDLDKVAKLAELVDEQCLEFVLRIFIKMRDGNGKACAVRPWQRRVEAHQGGI